MDGTTLQDRISRGLGAAARHVGQTFDAFRPNGAANPLAPELRYLRLQAAFNAEDGKFKRPQAYGRATWWGVFDSAYTRPGDYLQGKPAPGLSQHNSRCCHRCAPKPIARSASCARQRRAPPG